MFLIFTSEVFIRVFFIRLLDSFFICFGWYCFFLFCFCYFYLLSIFILYLISGGPDWNSVGAGRTTQHRRPDPAQILCIRPGSGRPKQGRAVLTLPPGSLMPKTRQDHWATVGTVGQGPLWALWD